MAERPILFSAPMVRALLAGTKPQTRRVLKTDIHYTEHLASETIEDMELRGYSCFDDPDGNGFMAKPPHNWRDRLWVRETWADVNLNGAPGLTYRANDHLRDLMREPEFLGDDGSFDYEAERLRFGEHGLLWSAWAHDLIAGAEGRWRSPLHMPRWASRITLLVTDVRVQRLQDISEADAIAEGIARSPHGNGDQWLNYPEGSSAAGWTNPIDSYRTLWNDINGSGSWSANPWVVAYTFTVEKHRG